jgi:hypothetical protein
MNVLSVSSTKDRQVLCADAVTWLLSDNSPFEGSICTGIPDINDIPEFSKKDVGIEERSNAYKEWFICVLDAIFKRLACGQFAIFSQTDKKVIGPGGILLCWMDKSYLCTSVAEKYGCTLLWHKFAINSDGDFTEHRPCYTHLLCYGKQISYPIRLFQTPDVIERGHMIWKKAIGIEACVLCIAFLCSVGHVNQVINPFSGHGTILAVANYFNMKAFGVEISVKRARLCLSREVDQLIESIPLPKLFSLGVTNEMLIGKSLLQVQQSISATKDKTVENSPNVFTTANISSSENLIV